MRRFPDILNISYKDDTRNEKMKEQQVRKYEDQLITIKRRRMKWYG